MAFPFLSLIYNLISPSFSFQLLSAAIGTPLVAKGALINLGVDEITLLSFKQGHLLISMLLCLFNMIPMVYFTANVLSHAQRNIHSQTE